MNRDPIKQIGPPMPYTHDTTGGQPSWRDILNTPPLEVSTISSGCGAMICGHCGKPIRYSDGEWMNGVMYHKVCLDGGS